MDASTLSPFSGTTEGRSHASSPRELVQAASPRSAVQSDLDDREWEKEDGMGELSKALPSRSPSPPQQQHAFKEVSNNDDLKNARTHELIIKVAPNESNKNILDVAEQALTVAPFDARSVHREGTRTVMEVGLRPVTIEIGLSRDLDRCVLVKVFEPVPENLFVALRDCFSKQIQLSTRVSSDLSGPAEEHEETIDGDSVKTLLDPDYVEMLKKEMKLRCEKDLTAFATPLERRAKDDERRVKRLEGLLTPKYAACRLPLPASEQAPPLSSFPLNLAEEPAKLILKSSPTPREVDAQLKMALRRNLHNDSLARQERKKKEVLARAEVCERNRLNLVSVLSNSHSALELDRELMDKLGVSPAQVALCRVGCLHARKPGFLVVTHQMLIFEPVGMWGFRLGEIIKLTAANCRSVMKGQGNIGIADSLCVRTDTNEEYVFYFPTIEEVNDQMDMVFELIWQVLRMNRWINTNNNSGAVQRTSESPRASSRG
jgi:hypothetical protein